MIILGINAYHANASAAIVVDGRLIAAVEEERLNRVKYAAGLPARAIQFCLDQAGAKLTEVDHIAVPRDPWARLGTKLRFAGIREDLAAAFELAPDELRAPIHRIEHHTAHLAGRQEDAFLQSFDAHEAVARAMRAHGPFRLAAGRKTARSTCGAGRRGCLGSLRLRRDGAAGRVRGLARAIAA